MIEKRQYRRVPIKASATLRFKNKENTPPVNAMVRNISISGICLNIGRHIEENACILVEIKSTSVDGNMYNNAASGRVVYVNIIDGNNYTGIEFDELINPVGQPELYEHLSALMPSSFNES